MYRALKTALDPIEGLEDVQWYNNQYEGIIGVAPVVYVEFSPLTINQAVKLTGQTEIGVHLHVVTEVVSENEGDIPDSLVEQHHALADEVLEAVEGYRFPFDDELTRPLQLVGWTPEYKYNGWLVTKINFKTKA